MELLRRSADKARQSLDWNSHGSATLMVVVVDQRAEGVEGGICFGGKKSWLAGLFVCTIPPQVE